MPPARQTLSGVLVDAPNVKLRTCCEILGIELKNAHSATADAKASLKLFHKLAAKLAPGELGTFLQTFGDPDSECDFPERVLFAEDLERPYAKPRTVAIELPGAKKPDVVRSPIEALLHLLPDAPKEGASVYAYAELLDRVLEDEVIADSDLAELTKLATEHGLSTECVCFAEQLTQVWFGQVLSRELAGMLATNLGFQARIALDEAELLVVSPADTECELAVKARAQNIRVMTETTFWGKLGVGGDR